MEFIWLSSGPRQLSISYDALNHYKFVLRMIVHQVLQQVVGFRIGLAWSSEVLYLVILQITKSTEDLGIGFQFL